MFLTVVDMQGPKANMSAKRLKIHSYPYFCRSPIVFAMGGFEADVKTNILHDFGFDSFQLIRM